MRRQGLRAADAKAHSLTLSPNGPYSQRLPAMISGTGLLRSALGWGQANHGELLLTPTAQTGIQIGAGLETVKNVSGWDCPRT
jgi:hypothetical protein